MDTAVTYQAIADPADKQTPLSPRSARSPRTTTALVVAAVLLTAFLAVSFLSRAGVPRAYRVSWPARLPHGHVNEYSKLLDAARAVRRAPAAVRVGVCTRDYAPVCCIQPAKGIFTVGNPCECEAGGTGSIVVISRPCEKKDEPDQCGCSLSDHNLVCCNVVHWGSITAISPCVCRCFGGFPIHPGFC